MYGNFACRDFVGQLANWLFYHNIMCAATTRLLLLNLVFCLWDIHIEKKPAMKAGFCFWKLTMTCRVSSLSNVGDLIEVVEVHH